MKIYNVIILLVIIALAICLSFVKPGTIKMTSENFSQILKEVHDSPYKYENKKIEMVGYVFRVNDFDKNQFVVARDMLINDSESRIIGFLCESPEAEKLQNNEWIHVTR